MYSGLSLDGGHAMWVKFLASYKMYISDEFADTVATFPSGGFFVLKTEKQQQGERDVSTTSVDVLS